MDFNEDPFLKGRPLLRLARLERVDYRHSR